MTSYYGQSVDERMQHIVDTYSALYVSKLSTYRDEHTLSILMGHIATAVVELNAGVDIEILHSGARISRDRARIWSLRLLPYKVELYGSGQYKCEFLLNETERIFYVPVRDNRLHINSEYVEDCCLRASVDEFECDISWTLRCNDYKCYANVLNKNRDTQCHNDTVALLRHPSKNNIFRHLKPSAAICVEPSQFHYIFTLSAPTLIPSAFNNE
jgi:hypothetical protein